MPAGLITGVGPNVVVRQHSGYALRMASYRFFTSPEDVGQAVREGRKALGLTQRQLAEKAGVSRTFVIDLEAGHRRAELGKVIGVLSAVDVYAYAVPSAERPDPQESVDLKKLLSRFD